MGQGITIPDKQGLVRETNPFPIEIVEGDDIVDVDEVGGKSALAVYLTGGSLLGNVSFDSVEVTSKNANGDPLVIVYTKATVTVATLTIVYDVDGDFQSLTKS